MIIIYDLLVAWFMSSIALGVGSSTLAIAAFLRALGDNGKIDTSERRIMGVIYVALRYSMVTIALTLFLLAVLFPGTISTQPYIWVLLAVLSVNAVLMTKHWISFKIGPALQAATWYTMNFMVVIETFDLLPVSWSLFGALYVFDIAVSLVMVNVLLWWFLERPKQAQSNA